MKKFKTHSLLTLCLLFLVSGCFSSKTNTKRLTTDDGDNSPPTTAEVDTSLTFGSWRQELCSPTGGGTSGNNIVISDDNGPDTIEQLADIYQYSATACPSGTGAPMNAVSTMGSITFDTMIVDGAGRYFKGTWTPTVSSPTPVIWAFPTPNQLCFQYSGQY
jgi:hypothetical protein